MKCDPHTAFIFRSEDFWKFLRIFCVICILWRYTDAHYHLIRNHISFDDCNSDNSLKIRDSAMKTQTEIGKQIPNGCAGAAYLWHKSLLPFFLDRAKWSHYSNTFKRCLGREVKEYLYLTGKLHFSFSLESWRLKITHGGHNLKLLNTSTHRCMPVCLHTGVKFFKASFFWEMLETASRAHGMGLCYQPLLSTSHSEFSLYFSDKQLPHVH